jgi:hypothetical protein
MRYLQLFLPFFLPIFLTPLAYRLKVGSDMMSLACFFSSGTVGQLANRLLLAESCHHATTWIKIESQPTHKALALGDEAVETPVDDGQRLLAAPLARHQPS